MSTTSERVRALICEELGVRNEELDNDASLIDELGADSLDMVELTMSIEEEFECEIHDDDVAKITTVQDAIDCVEAQVAGR